MAAVFGGREFVDTRQADCCAGFGINHNVFSEAFSAGVDRIHFASSACVYPPRLQEDSKYLLKEDDAYKFGEADNSYGWVKLMGEMELKCYHEQYRLKCSTCRYLTVYGQGEYDESHSIPALMAKAIRRMDPYVIWGSGEQERGFTYVRDIVDGSILACEKIVDATPLNLGRSNRYKIKDVARLILEISGHKPSKVMFDSEKPEGPFSRALDISRAKKLLGWTPKVDLPAGLEKTYQWMSGEGKPLFVEASKDAAPSVRP
jgi:UDP-glucose 4-epimerase